MLLTETLLKLPQKRAKKGKIFENLGKNIQNLKIFLEKAGDFVQLSLAISC